MPTGLRGKKQTSLKDAPKRQYTWSAEKRRFVRFPCAWKIKFCDLGENQPKTLHHGKCRNLSQGGMKMSAVQPLKRNAIILLEIDSNLFSVHIKLNSILKISKNHLLAQVAWRHLNLETGLFEAGIQFLEESQRHRYQAELEKAALV